MTERQVTITLVNPVAEYLQETSEKIRLARRLNTLDGKVVCLLANWRPSAVRLLNAMGNILSRRFKLKEIIREQPVRQLIPSDTGGLHMVEVKMGELVQRCDAIITAVGD
ncbi:hypothetical protein ACFLTY_03135 [Chloroflexota bacterium]